MEKVRLIVLPSGFLSENYAPFAAQFQARRRISRVSEADQESQFQIGSDTGGKPFAGARQLDPGKPENQVTRATVFPCRPMLD